MYCQNCGHEIAENAVFCRYCGKKVETSEAAFNSASVNPNVHQAVQNGIPEGIVLCPDGKYRWTYEVKMWKNPVMLITALKILIGGVIFLACLLMIMEIYNDSDIIYGLKIFFMTMLIGTPVAVVLSLLGYLLAAAINGGNYCAVFTMDENSVIHAQAKHQEERWRIFSVFGLITTGDVANYIALNNQVFESQYGKVKRIKAVPKRDLIKVHGVLIKNKIFAEPHQYEFVYRYITRHCQNARIT